MKDPLLLSYTQEELQVEYFMDWSEDDPMQEHASTDGVQFRTGDEVVDEWEEALARGETPDFEASVDSEFLERFKRHSKKQTLALNPALATAEAKAEKEAEGRTYDLDLEDLGDSLEGFEDDYGSEEPGA
jgi:hypothetical protein